MCAVTAKLAAQPPATASMARFQSLPNCAVLAERQLVAAGQRDDVPRVEERRPVVGLDVVAVDRVGALGGDVGRAVVAEVVRVGLAQRVVGDEVEAVPQPLLEGRLQRVVVGRGRATAVVLMSVISGLNANSGRRVLQRRPGARVADAGQRLVALDRRHQVLRLVADVADVDRRARADQVLGEQVPLLRELRPQVRIPGAELTPDGRSSACSPSKPVAMVLGAAGRVVGRSATRRRTAGSAAGAGWRRCLPCTA